MFDDKKRVLAENDDWIIYENDITKSANEQLHRPDKYGISFEYCYVALAYNKLDEKSEYIIENEKGKVIYATPIAEELFFHIDLMKIVKREQFDLRTIVEAGEVPKSV